MSAIPKTQHGVQIVGVDELVWRDDLPVPPVGPTQLLIEMQACGICFSDTKLMHAFTDHPRKGPVVSGLTDTDLASIPGYSAGDQPIVPGHEPVGVIVAVGDRVTHHAVGQRVLIQTDYRHLRTRATNAAFGYTFDGGLQQYVLLDERVCVGLDGASYNLPVTDGPSAAAIALCEPWACVEASYSWGDRTAVRQGGRQVTIGAGGVAFAAVGDGPFDDIIYRGADASEIERLADRLASGGVLAVALDGATIDRPVQLDLGRVHYDGVRYCGTTGGDIADAYAHLLPSYELRPGDRVAVVGASGAMGLMHTVRALTSNVTGLTVDALDDPDRPVERLAAIVEPVAARTGVAVRIAGFDQARDDYTYIALNVRSLIDTALAMSGDRCILNVFAGFAVGTRVEVDLQRVIERRVQLVGTSGSRVADMTTVLRKVESGELDTQVSMVALTGMAGVPDAIEAVRQHTSGGKIMVYPPLPDLGYVRLDDLAEVLPEVAARLEHGLWTKAAEDVLLAAGQSPPP